MMSAAVMCLALAMVISPVAARARIGKPQQAFVPKEFVLTITVVFLVVTVLMAVGTFALAIAGAIAAATVLVSVRQVVRRRRIMADTKALGAYIGQLAADIDSGAHHFHAVETAAEHLPDDTPPRVRTIAESAAAQARFGHSPAYAFTQHSSAELPQLQRLAVLWSAAGRHGIALAGLLESVHRSITGASRHRSATEASLQGPQATAVILTCLPLAGIAMGMAMGAAPISFLLTTQLGGIALVCGVGLSCAGFMWSRTITSKAIGDTP